MVARDGIDVAVSDVKENELHEADDDIADYNGQSMSDSEHEYDDVRGDSEDEVMFGSSAESDAEAVKLQQLMNDPSMRKFVDMMVDKKLKAREAEKNGKNKGGKKMLITPKGREPPLVVRHVIKSPSDTTSYTPALKLIRNNSQSNVMVGGQQRFPIVDVANLSQGKITMQEDVSKDKSNGEIIEKISDFVESLRMEADKDRDSDAPEAGQRSEVVIPGQAAAQGRIEKAILDAERFKATVANPSGKLINFDDAVPGDALSVGKTDDEFFHMTCHIDQPLVDKIERGQYVDLDKLLPKTKGKIQRPADNFNRLEWVQGEGGTFLVPADRGSRINSVGKWEQAFRAYATIYVGANPGHAKEV